MNSALMDRAAFLDSTAPGFTHHLAQAKAAASAADAGVLPLRLVANAEPAPLVANAEPAPLDADADQVLLDVDADPPPLVADVVVVLQPEKLAEVKKINFRMGKPHAFKKNVI